MDFSQVMMAVTDLLHGHITSPAVVLVLNIVVGVITYVAGYFKTSPHSKLIETIHDKMLFVEKYIDKTMYDDQGTYCQAKEDMAISMIKTIYAKMPESEIRSIIKALSQKADSDLDQLKKEG